MMLFKKLIKIFLTRFFSLFFHSKKSKVIFYHDIHSNEQYTDMSTSIKLFERHIQIINQSGYEIVSRITKEYGQIEICFDDGFLGLYKNIDFLKNKKVPIHLFIATSFLDRDKCINSQQLLELSRLDLVRISSHTHSHKILNLLDENDMQKELQCSKDILEELLENPVDSICFPEGKFNYKTISISKKIGYKKQYSSLPGCFCNKFQNKIIKRSLVQFAGEKEFRSILEGGDAILGFWYRLKHFKR